MHTEPEANPDPLADLLRLLYLDGASAPPTKADFAAWKPRAEQLGRSQHSEASRVAELLAAVAQQSGSPDLMAYALWIGGNVHHDRNAMRLAHEAYAAAATLYHELGDQLNLARMSIGWVHVLGELGETAEALRIAQATEKALAASDEPADAVRLVNFYGNRGTIYEQIGQFGAALADYERKWAYYRLAPALTVEAVVEGAMVLNDIGVIHTLLGQYKEAERRLRAAHERLAPYADDAAVRADITMILMNRAWLATLRQSPFGVVRKAFQQARESRDRLGDPVDQLYCAHIELDEANWLIRSGHWQDVRHGELSRLRSLAAAQGLANETIYAGLLLGQLDYLAGAVEQARRSFEQLIHAAADKLPALAYLACLWKARAWRLSGDTDRAEQSLQQAIEHIERARRQLTMDDYRAGYLEDKLIAYQDLLLLHLERGQYTAALAVSERSKARTLADAIEADAAGHALAPPAAVAGWSLAHVTAQLAPDVLAISYAEVHEQVWAFLLDQRGLVDEPVCLGPRLRKAEVEDGLAKVQRVVYAGFTATEELREQIAWAQTPLGAWYSAYLAPLQPWLDRYPQLLIAADGLLNALPFACLYNRERHRYLVETHTIALTPSLALWPALLARQMRRPRGAGVLALGNSSIDGAHGALPATSDEAAAVAELFAGSVLLREEEAVLARFIDYAAQSQLIYLAAHGAHQAGEPGASYIELRDGPLRARAILELDLPGPIVVLSACNTGQGHLIGNEMMGLVRSFLYAGASAVVSAHWQVADSASLRMMAQAMRSLGQGLTLTDAIRQSQITCIEERESHLAHPFFWGALTVTGTGNLSPKEHHP